MVTEVTNKMIKCGGYETGYLHVFYYIESPSRSLCYFFIDFMDFKKYFLRKLSYVNIAKANKIGIKILVVSPVLVRCAADCF